MKDAMFDNTGEIDYILKKLLPEAKLNKDKNGYNKLLAKAQSEAKIIVNPKRVHLLNTPLLRCVEFLHQSEELYFNEDVSFLTKGFMRKVKKKNQIKDNKTDINKEHASCYITRYKKNDSVSSIKDLVYSPEEKLMLYIFMSCALKRKMNKAMVVDNYVYLSLKDIYHLFGYTGNKVESKYKKKLTGIIDNLEKDTIEIYIYGDRISNKWFTSFIEARDYDGNLQGYFYIFAYDDLIGITKSHTKVVTDRVLCITKEGGKSIIKNKDLSQNEISRYLLYQVYDRKKKIKLVQIMKDLYDYDNGDTYYNIFMSKSNPDNNHYLISFIEKIESVLSAIEFEMDKTITAFYLDENKNCMKITDTLWFKPKMFEDIYWLLKSAQST